MDHIPQPLHCCRPLERVPYMVCSEHLFDGQSFAEFPKRKQIRIGSKKLEAYLNREGSSEPINFEDTCSFVQSWLFFGLLEAAGRHLQVPVNLADFVKGTSGEGKYLTTEPLSSIIQAMSMPTLEEPSNEQLLESHMAGLLALQKHLILLDRHVELWDRRGKALFLHQEPDPAQFEIATNICTSIVCLGESLNSIYKDLRKYPPALPDVIFQHKMKESGYCPHVTYRIEQICQPASCRHYISNMRPAIIENHNNCSKSVCRSLTLDENSYKRRHAPGCDERICQDITVEDFRIQAENDRPISQILSTGEIPVVTVDSSAFPPKIHLHSTTKKSDPAQLIAATRYVAISHVWSDGLGNPKRNSLLSCQANWLQKLVNGLYGELTNPVPFWLDTICVPIEPSFRKAAIIAMKDTYEQAEKVLVLDKWLFSAPVGIAIHEKLIRLCISTWSMRLWTLQESIHGKDLYYQLPDGPMTYAQLEEEALECNSTTDDPMTEKYISLGRDAILSFSLFLVERFNQTREFLDGAEDARFKHIHNSFVFRTTSRAEDEALCLASLTGVSPREVLEQAKEDMMRVIFRSMKVVPAELLFMNRARYKEKGDRWIPRTLLWQPNHIPRLLFEGKSGDVGVDGLHVTFPGYRFRNGLSAQEASPKALAFMADGIKFYAYVLREVLTDDTEKNLLAFAQADIAIVWSELPSRDNQRVEGSLVRIQTHGDNGDHSLIRGRFEMVLVAYSESTGPRISVLLHDITEVLPQDQRWCIG